MKRCYLILLIAASLFLTTCKKRRDTKEYISYFVGRWAPFHQEQVSGNSFVCGVLDYIIDIHPDATFTTYRASDNAEVFTGNIKIEHDGNNYYFFIRGTKKHFTLKTNKLFVGLPHTLSSGYLCTQVNNKLGFGAVCTNYSKNLLFFWGKDYPGSSFYKLP